MHDMSLHYAVLSRGGKEDLKRYDRDADIAVEHAGILIKAGYWRVIFKAGSGIELEAAARQPVTQDGIPGVNDCSIVAFECHAGILATGYGGQQGIAKCRETGRNFHRRIVTAQRRVGNAGIIVTDTITCPRE